MRIPGTVGWRLLSALTAAALVFLVVVAGSASAAMETEEFAIERVEASESSSEAGMHPDQATYFELTRKTGSPESGSGYIRHVGVAFPPGFVANPNLVPACSTAEFRALECPADSQVGVAKIRLTASQSKTAPLYRLEVPNQSMVARFGFFKLTLPIFIDVDVRTATDYGVTATVDGAPGESSLVSTETILWGNPSDPSHDTERLTASESFICETACLAPEGKRSSNLGPIAFTANPTACEQQEVGFDFTNYQSPDHLFASAQLPEIIDCASLPFSPDLSVEPTSRVAGAPTGLSAVLKIPQTSAVNVPATSAMRDAKVVFPEGMTLAAGAADGLAGCSDAQVRLGTEVQSECPEAAKLGSATFVSPDLPEPLHGAIYQRTPEPGHLFRLWLVTDEFGLHLKIPGEVHADPKTGQLTAVFSETPQLPVEEIDLEFKAGPRAPLKNPDNCGTYAAGFEFTPWSGGPPVTGQSTMQITEGCGRAGGFSPTLSAGVERPVAGSYSPLSLNVIRQDEEENISRIDFSLPPGELAKLAGVPLCPDAAAPSGACPAGSQIGSVAVATGVGTQPLWIPQPGKQPTAVYLAGPYQGAPYSAITKVPAQAGPFDLGTVVVRAGIYIDPETTQATVKSDPLPQILEGVPLLYRTIHIAVDRSQFAISPTNCEPMSVGSTIVSAGGHVANPGDRFQVGECASLGFKPKLQLSLTGSTRHAGHPALKAVVTYPKQGAYANIARAQVNLPHSEFLDQSNLNKTCTKPVLLEGKCPATSIYGKAKAWTPLLEKPLEGPVYLVGGFGYKLPALVADLNGQIRVVLKGKVDSGPNKGIRNTFEAVPDAPVSRFVLEMKGGKKYSLLENSEDLCKKPQKAIARFTAQNGMVEQTKPLIVNQCGKKKAGKKNKGGKKRARRL